MASPLDLKVLKIYHQRQWHRRFVQAQPRPGLSPVPDRLCLLVELVDVDLDVVQVRLDRSEFLSGLERLAVSFTIGCYVLYLGVFFIAPYRLDSTSMWTLFAACFGVALFGLRR